MQAFIKDQRTCDSGSGYCLHNPPPDYVREGGTYEITVASPGNADLQLNVAGAFLEAHRVSTSADMTQATWLWHIEHYAGEVPVKVVVNGHGEATTHIDIAPHPGKLGRDCHYQLLAELQEMAEGVMFGLTPGHAKLDPHAAETPPVATYAMMRALLKPLRHAFWQISQSPHRRLESERAVVSLHRARKFDVRTLRSAARSGVAAAILRGTSGVSADVAAFDVPRMVHTFDTPSNRYVAYLHKTQFALCCCQ